MNFPSQSWLQNLKQMLFSRPAWRPEDEYAYYSVTPEVVRQHAQNQVQYEREAHRLGLEMAHSMGILDAETLRTSRILDIGAGECVLTEALALAAGAAEVVAVDAVPKQIWAAAAHHRDTPNLKFVIADAANLPYRAGSFDLAVGHLLLHHINPIGPVFSELIRVLRPGGMFVAMEPSPIFGMLVHEVRSKNEAPVAPSVFVTEARKAGFVGVQFKYWWQRMNTSLLGPFSPGYRLTAKAPGDAPQASLALDRDLTPMAIPGLFVDSGCRFEATAVKQVAEIREVYGRTEKVVGFRGLKG